MAGKVGTNLSKTVDNVIIGVKEIQKSWDEKVQEYRETSTFLIPIDLVNAKDYYYLQVALPGVAKEDIELEATENSITIKAIFQNIESPEGLEPELVIKGLKNGNAKRTIPFANEIKPEEISAKFQDGALFLEIPKVATAKTKINID
ncbi:MAG: Hsp20/alpha crystallin family protein [archaeon]|nr:Hsp20/alpha crystallin family protein [archaeon]